VSSKKGKTLPPPGTTSRRSRPPPPPKLDALAQKPTVATVPLGSIRKNQKSSSPPPRSAIERPPIAFLGLGAMGRPMAARLVDAGFPVRVFNRTKSTMRSIFGASPATTPGDAARGAEIIVTMVSDGEALASLLEGKDGVLAAIASERRKPRPVIVDMSTIGRRIALHVSKRAEEHGARFVDAPVSGSVGPAGRGELLALVGGSVRSVERARPALEALCKRVIHAGGVGQGQALKIVLNGIGAHHLVAFTSMLALGEAAGLARDVLLDAFTNGAFASPSYVGKRNKVLARDYSPEFSLALTLKDCLLASELQEEVGLRLPVHHAILADVSAGVTQDGLGELDLFALEKHYHRRR
jgi:3-hydroxyisobutyrate dehydrogenase-like beta-hydroxyacid dehydrogenase